MSKNVTRQNIPQDPQNPKDHLNSGYEDSPSDFGIPSCGIEDCDFAIFDLFDKTIPFTKRVIKASAGPVELNKPFVILATGERFALAKRLKPPRDKRTKNLVLPAISIRRTSIEQTSDDITRRGMNQFTGNMIIKRQLDSQDIDYQNLINKLGFKNLGINFPETNRPTGEYKNEPEIIQGGLLTPLNNENIFEIISIPQPQFFTATYEVVFWTSYTQHMNYLIETLMSSYLPQGKMWKLETDKGYWFMGYFQDQYQNGENIDDFTETERLIRYNFSIKVKGYLLAPQGASNLVPVRKWISAPDIAFESIDFSSELSPKKTIEKIENIPKDKFVLTDIERDPAKAQTPTYNQKLLYKKEIINPKTGKKQIKYARVMDSNNKKGETVFSASDLQTLEEFLATYKTP